MVENHIEQTLIRWLGAIIRTLYKPIELVSSLVGRIGQGYIHWREDREGKKFVNLQQIKCIMREYTQKGLYELDEELLINKLKLKGLESSRTVYTALWKAGPLAVIPATSLILSIFQYIPSDNGEAVVLSACLLVFILALSFFCWRRSKRIDREIGLTDTRLEQIQKNVESRMAAVRADLLEYIQEMDRKSIWENGNAREILNDSIKTRIPLNMELRFGSRRVSDMVQRYPSLMTDIQIMERCEGDFLEIASEYYDKAKTALINADRENGIDQSTQHKDGMPNNLRGLFIIHSNKIITKTDLLDKKGKLNMSNPELHFAQQIFGDKSFEPYSKFIDDEELNSIALKVREEYESCVTTYARVREQIRYAVERGG